MSLAVHLTLVFHIFIAGAVMVMVCGRHVIGPYVVVVDCNGSVGCVA